MQQVIHLRIIPWKSFTLKCELPRKRTSFNSQYYQQQQQRPSPQLSSPPPSMQIYPQQNPYPLLLTNPYSQVAIPYPVIGNTEPPFSYVPPGSLSQTPTPPPYSISSSEMTIPGAPNPYQANLPPNAQLYPTSIPAPPPLLLDYIPPPFTNLPSSNSYFSGSPASLRQSNPQTPQMIYSPHVQSNPQIPNLGYFPFDLPHPNPPQTLIYAPPFQSPSPEIYPEPASSSSPRYSQQSQRPYPPSHTGSRPRRDSSSRTKDYLRK